MTLLVSVLLPVHNGGPYVAEAVRSLLAQRLAAFECVVVDDASTDDTPRQLDALKRQDGRVVVLRCPQRRGVTASLNSAAAAARGRYLARQDADDWSHPERLARQVAFLEAHPSVGAVGSSADIMDAQGRTIGRVRAPQGPARVRRALLGVRVTPVHGSMVMRREVFEAAGGYREAFLSAQDFDLWLRLIERSAIDNLPEVLYRWRLHPDGVYATRRADQLTYGAAALAFARERALYGQDSYELLAATSRDVEAFAQKFRLRRAFHAIAGKLLLRGLPDVSLGQRHLRQALALGDRRPSTLWWYGLSLLGVGSWGRPVALQAHRMLCG